MTNRCVRCLLLAAARAVVLVMGFKVTILDIAGTPYMALAQMVDMVKSMTDISTATIKRAYYVIKPRTVEATASQLRHLVASGVVSKNAGKAVLVSVASVVRTLEKLRLPHVGAAFKRAQAVTSAPTPEQLIPSMPNISREHQSQALQAVVDAQQAASHAARVVAAVAETLGPVMAAPGPRDPALQAVFPTEVQPADLESQPNLKTCQIALSSQAKVDAAAARQWKALAGPLQSLSSFSSSHVNGARTEHGSLKSSSMDRTCSGIGRFMGYLYKVEELPQPCLGHYLNAPLLAGFLGFEMARGVQGKELGVHVAIAKRVVEFLVGSGQLHTSRDFTLLPRHKEWLATLTKQFGDMPKVHAMATTHPDDMAAACASNLTSVDLLRRVHKVGQAAEELVPAAKASFQAAVRYTQLLMVYMLGGVLPGLRTSVMFSLCRPDYDGPCTHSHCPNKRKCRGNRVDIVNHPEPGGGIGGVGMAITVVHHKTERSRSSKPLRFLVPVELQRHLTQLLQGGIRDTLVKHTGGSNPPFVFLTSTGGAYYSQLFYKIFRRHVGIPPSAAGGPHMTRTALVDVMRGPAGKEVQAAAPNEAGVASLLQNSTSVWNSHYDRHMRERETMQAVEAYPTWIGEVLARADDQAKASSRAVLDQAGTGGIRAAPTAATEATSSGGAGAAGMIHTPKPETPSVAVACTPPGPVQGGGGDAAIDGATVAFGGMESKPTPAQAAAVTATAAAACDEDDDDDYLEIIDRPVEVIDLCDASSGSDGDGESCGGDSSDWLSEDSSGEDSDSGTMSDGCGSSSDDASTTSSSSSGDSDAEPPSRCTQGPDLHGCDADDAHMWEACMD